MTSKQIDKLQGLRGVALVHGDDATVTLIDAAIAGDSVAAAKLGMADKAHRAVATGAAARAPRTRRPAPGITSPAHPWAHDEE